MRREKDIWLERVARLAAWASLAYDSEATSRDFDDSYGNGNSLLMAPMWLEHESASAYVLCDKLNGLVVSITGTNSLDDWSVNLRLGVKRIGDLRVSSTAWGHALKIARQFCALAAMEAGGSLTMADRWMLLLGNSPSITVIGHSLGGAVAILFPLAVRSVLSQIRRGSLVIGRHSREHQITLLDAQESLWKALTHNSEVITYGAWRPLTVDTAAYYPYRATHVELVGDVGVLWPPWWLGRWHPGRLIVVDHRRHRLYARHSGVGTLMRQLWALVCKDGFRAHDSQTYVHAMSSWLTGAGEAAALKHSSIGGEPSLARAAL